MQNELVAVPPSQKFGGTEGELARDLGEPEAWHHRYSACQALQRQRTIMEDAKRANRGCARSSSPKQFPEISPFWILGNRRSILAI